MGPSGHARGRPRQNLHRGRPQTRPGGHTEPLTAPLRLLFVFVFLIPHYEGHTPVVYALAVAGGPSVRFVLLVEVLRVPLVDAVVPCEAHDLLSGGGFVAGWGFVGRGPSGAPYGRFTIGKNLTHRTYPIIISHIPYPTPGVLARFFAFYLVRFY